MKIVFTVLIFLLVTILLSCQKSVSNQLTKQELEVYKTILGDKPKEIVVIDVKSVGVFGEIETGGLKEILVGLQNDTFDNFVKVNSVPPKIEGDIQANFNYPLVNGIDFNNDNLEHVRYYVFSRAGFSRDGRQAVVMFNSACLPLCGRGAYYLLEYKNEVWEVMQESEFYRS